MNLIDVHCHLNHALFKDDLEPVLERAKKAGLKAIVCSGVNPVSNKEVLELAKKYPFIKACLGIYPIDALGLAENEFGLPRQPVPINLDEEFRFIEKNKNNIIGIGEIGMDFHWADKEKTYAQQAENFRKIIRFAIKVKKPIVIHTRKAELECIDILEQEVHGEIPVDLHCFSGKKALIKRAAALGYYFSVPPNIIRSHSFQELVKIVDLRQLLTETDAPYLSPYTEQRNEPAFVVETIKKMAEIKRLTNEEVAEAIWKNYEKVFEQKNSG
ncbi:TatD family hydrolase [Candidatus Woesearchaeota archaeon]|nr:TatD family hydrolase [Candidatus Woesearchaeota archaeon]